MIVFTEQVEGGRNKKVYSITEPGRAAFYQWMFDPIPVNKLEVTALSKVYFLGLIQSMEDRQQIIHEILRKIEMVQDELNSMNEEFVQLDVPLPYREIFNYQLKTLDYGRKAHSFAREWFQDLLIDLESRN